jgi:hypothetical protein
MALDLSHESGSDSGGRRGGAAYGGGWLRDTVDLDGMAFKGKL